MEAPEPKSKLIKLVKIPINPFVFWVIISLVLAVVLLLIVRISGVSNGIHWLLLIPVFAYLVIMGIFIGYVSHLQRERDRLLAERLERETDRSRELKKLNQDLETYAKQLYDKDMELTLANQHLQKLEQAKSKFVSVTTHQLRTPLAAIKWTFHMLLGNHFGTVTAEQRDFLQKGYDSTQRMIAIINDILNVDHIEADQEDYNFLEVDLLDLAESVKFEFINQARSRKIKFELVKPQSELPLVIADPVKISMVLENLMDNALKYTPIGGRVTIRFDDARINSARPSLEIVISDSGIGIPPAERERIFHRFFRGSNAIRLEPGGTGLGLFIAQDIIAKHQGEIWFESKEGEGASFHFTLPIKK